MLRYRSGIEVKGSKWYLAACKRASARTSILSVILHLCAGNHPMLMRGSLYGRVLIFMALAQLARI